MSAGHLAGSFLWLQFVQLATLENSALKCVFPVPTTPRATTGTVTVNVYQAGPLSTAPNVSATGFHAERGQYGAFDLFRVSTGLELEVVIC